MLMVREQGVTPSSEPAYELLMHQLQWLSFVVE